MKFIDLSQPVFDQCPNYPADPPVRSRVIVDHAKDGWRVEQLTLTSHTGSHVDAPLHGLTAGQSIDSLPLERFAGWAVLADLRQCRPGQPFTSSMLARTLRVDLKDRIVLIATGWGAKRAKTRAWLTRGPYLAPDGAHWLVDQKIRGVAIDQISIGGLREPQNQLTHQSLLAARIWIMEDLRFPPRLFTLPQPLQFWGLPINLRGHSGAFCRPVIVTG